MKCAILLMLPSAALAGLGDAQPTGDTKPPTVEVLYAGPIREHIAYPKPTPAPRLVESYPVPMRYQPMPVRREVAPGIPFHAGHNCPQCGRSQYVVAGQLPNGEHVHTCSAGHSWRHR